MSGELYGAKCSKCQHITHRDNPAPVRWVTPPDDCQNCSFCQYDAMWGALLRSLPDDAWSGDVLAATRAFKRGESHPLIDQLRASLQQEERATDAD